MELSYSLKLLQLFCNLFVMCPYSFETNKRTFENKKFTPFFLFQLIIIVVFCVIFPGIDYPYYRNHYVSLGVTVDTLHTIFYFTKQPLCVALILLIHLRRDDINNFLNTSAQLDEKFYKLLRHKTCYRSLKRRADCFILLSFIGGGLYMFGLVVDYSKYCLITFCLELL